MEQNSQNPHRKIRTLDQLFSPCKPPSQTGLHLAHSSTVFTVVQFYGFSQIKCFIHSTAAKKLVDLPFYYPPATGAVVLPSSGEDELRCHYHPHGEGCFTSSMTGSKLLPVWKPIIIVVFISIDGWYTVVLVCRLSKCYLKV